MVLKIICLCRIHIQWNLINPVRIRQMVTIMKVGRNTWICTYFGRNVLDGCRENHDELPIVYLEIRLIPYYLWKLPCHLFVLLCLEFFICLIEISCPSLFLPNLDPIPCRNFEAFSKIHVILEAVICKELPPLREITYHLQRNLRDGDGDLGIYRIK